jgi:hypothetical protein
LTRVETLASSWRWRRDRAHGAADGGLDVDPGARSGGFGLMLRTALAAVLVFTVSIPT